MTFVDTNVLIDIVTADPNWLQWSLNELDRAKAAGPLLINDIVYAELASRYEHIESLDAFLSDLEVVHESIPRQALFLAGQAHTRYRRAGGTRLSVLPDFFIGAHAAILGAPLLTRDPARYRTYFPSVYLIEPQSN